MLFLIDYDRRAGQMVSLQRFAESQRSEAYDARFALELLRDREGCGHEVVLLEAAEEAGIRRTHRRYFESLSELARLPDGTGNGRK